MNILKKVGNVNNTIFISVAIIVIIFILAIPNLITKITENGNITKLKTTSNTIINLFYYYKISDNEKIIEYSKNKNNISNLMKDLKPYIVLQKDCGTIKDNKKDCTYENSYKDLDGTNKKIYFNTNEFYKVVLPSGVAVWFSIGDNIKDVKNDKILLTMYIDTNDNFPPNTWGKDLFYYQYFEDIGFLAGGNQNTSTTMEETCNKQSSGMGCAYYIQTKNNMNYLK